MDRRRSVLRFDNETVKAVAELIRLHLRFFGYADGIWTDSAVRRSVRDAGCRIFPAPLRCARRRFHDAGRLKRFSHGGHRGHGARLRGFPRSP